jgi:3-deoxy-D-manno-octulosonic-acid transferase
VSQPFTLSLYRGLMRLLAPVMPSLLRHRAKKGKEDPERRHERLGQPTSERPGGRLVWLHGASVGESMVLATLVEELGGLRPDLNFLVTTGTTTSAQIMASRLPSNARHQYVPIDSHAAVTGFLDHWKPDLAVFAESELWPNLVTETASRGISMALVNARMNAKSLKNWHQRKNTARHLFACFDWIGTADIQTQKGIGDLLGQPVRLAGNLKLEARAATPDPHALTAARVGITGRHVWLAASTHDGEEDQILDAHRALQKDHPNALLILVPRHPERAQSIASRIKKRGWQCAWRSRNELPNAQTPVWLADTLGELALWYTLCPASLIAGSLKDGIGGHNPIEASQAGATVICGPYRASFQDLYQSYRSHGAALFVNDAPSLATAVQDIWNGHRPSRQNVDAAIQDASGGALKTTLDALLDLLADDDDPGEAGQ